ncbi:transglycosylase SLT domain-containing protein [Paracoccus onubensis]|uniref:Lytic transglycosylase domain-containing protein n=1 Tax=Paracoccus onubensis TaxID=1675788 RepID=A0A418T8E6_9RHOB|nr:transglycosylase SLT domain-containing protein [Paracoccus onubensis]RJE89498.1 lytic transglycosylase domain-containing protein [Paracoccus onubensis]
MNVNSALSGWQSFVSDRQSRMDATNDEALKKHFAAEIELAQQTIESMGSDAPSAPDMTAPEPQADQFPVKTNSEAEPGDGKGQSGAMPELTGKLAQYQDEIRIASEATGVPPELLAAVIWDESKGIASAATTNGENGLTDSGLMQVNPETFAALKAKHPDLLPGGPDDVQSNIMAGALYLAEQKATFGDWDLALRAYNSGPGSVDPSDPSISTTGLGTKNYVDKVNFFEDLIARGQVLPDGFPGGNQMY